MKKACCLVLTLLLALTVAAGPLKAADRGVLFQYSTINALMDGVYDGDLTYGELARHGDFGLGTFNALDGEMIALEGKFYQVKADGSVRPVPDYWRTPFAQVTSFHPDKVFHLSETLDSRQLEKFLEKRLPSPNLIYAVKIQGTFSYVKTRSVSRQRRPYPPLTESAKKQAVFEFQEVAGTVVGFLIPKYLGGVNVTGAHLHFLTADSKAGGHLLDCRIAAATRVEICELDGLQLRLPRTEEFLRLDLSGGRDKEIEKVER
jgi:acetolactate decarboxylase